MTRHPESVPYFSYILIYRKTADAVEILRIWDGRTDWQNRTLD